MFSDERLKAFGKCKQYNPVGPWPDSNMVWLGFMVVTGVAGVAGVVVEEEMTEMPCATSLWKQVDRVPQKEQEREVAGLVARLLGDRAADFKLMVNPKMRGEDGKEVATILGGGFTVEVVASSGVAAAWGLHHYLQQDTLV